MKKAIKEMAHFVTTPGVVNADKGSCTVGEYAAGVCEGDGYGHRGTYEGYWEKKILGLGSPKIDKVMATRKEDGSS